MSAVFVTGGTGYMGRALIRELLARGHEVRALARPDSGSKLPTGAQAVSGDALDAASFAASIPPCGTLVHLVGTPRPNPFKSQEFFEVDLASIRASLTAARDSTVRHLVYVSVAHPAPVMHSYIAARKEGEALLVASGIAATILRPWYVLGPGHRWPLALLPAFKLLEALPATRSAAQRSGLVTLAQMVAALVEAVESGGEGVRFRGVADIRRSGGAF